MSHDDRINEFISLLAANRNRVYAYILGRVPRPTDADDLMQETTMTMWNKFDTFEIGTDFVAWGIQIAKFKVLQFRGKQTSAITFLSDETIEMLDQDQRRPEDFSDDRIETLRQCMKKLPDHGRRLLTLRYKDNVSARKIAQRIGKSAPYVYKMLAKIHQTLFNCVNREALSS